MISFDDIIGQGAVVKSLQNSICNNRVSHAYIFEGPEGIGKKTVARIFAAALVCEKEQQKISKTGSACSVCSSCMQVAHDNHPDIKMINAVSTEGKVGSIGVDDIRQLQKDIYIKPYQASKKVYIIEGAEKMTIQAQNSLLKILEEPPVYGTLILTAQHRQQLLSTILSRSVCIKFRVHPQHEIEQFLYRQYPHIKEDIPIVTAFSGGMIGKAIQIADSEEFSSLRSEILAQAVKLFSQRKWEALESIDFFSKNKVDAQQILEVLVTWVRDILLIKEQCDDKYIINIDKRNTMQQFAYSVKTDALMRVIEIITDTQYKIKRNVNYTLAIEAMIIKSWEEIHGKRSRGAI